MEKRGPNYVARQLLLSYLTAAQKETFLQHLGFLVIGSSSKHKYAVGVPGSLLIYDEKYSYCCHLTHDDGGYYPPTDDHLLAQKIILETDEKYFLKRAFRMASNNHITVFHPPSIFDR